MDEPRIANKSDNKTKVLVNRMVDFNRQPKSVNGLSQYLMTVKTVSEYRNQLKIRNVFIRQQHRPRVNGFSVQDLMNELLGSCFIVLVSLRLHQSIPRLLILEFFHIFQVSLLLIQCQLMNNVSIQSIANNQPQPSHHDIFCRSSRPLSNPGTRKFFKELNDPVQGPNKQRRLNSIPNVLVA